MTDEPTTDQHHPDEVFAGRGQLVTEPITLVDARDDGHTVQAAVVGSGNVAIITSTSVDNITTDTGSTFRTSVELDAATLIRLAALVPPELVDQHAGADVIYLHRGPTMHDVVVEENGVTNALCQEYGCERRIERAVDADEWLHLPDPTGYLPTHAARPPASLVEVPTNAAADDAGTIS